MTAPPVDDPRTGRTLLIKAKGGLGNRMLSAITGLVYADLTGRTPVIDWRDGVYAPAGTNAYPLLFEAGGMPAPESLEGAASVTPGFWQGHLDLSPDRVVGRFEDKNHGSPRIYRKYSVPLESLDVSEDVAVFWSYLPKMARLRRHLRRDPRFAGRSTDDILSEYLDRYFRPNARVLREVEAFASGLPRPVIGVHIRYTDRKMSLDRVIAAIARERAKLPGAAVFLATDSAVAESRITEAVGEIHTTPKYLPEGDERLHSTQEVPFDKVHEAENAMIDMWALARADRLIYSKNSTFSLSSALIGRLRADQQVDLDRRDLRIVAKRLIQPYI